jgi:catechol 2,3-dioxygenase-like lactoylglutathione lyase family enzyme
MEKSTKTETQSWKLTQVGVVVRDVEKTIKRLTALGIGPFQQMVLPPEREEWFRDKRMYADFKIYGARIGDIQIELIQPLSGDSPHKEFLETKGEGIQHVMFAVDDFDKEVARLTKKGASILLRAKFPGGRGVAYLDLGVGNIIFELVQKRQDKL